MNFERPEGSAGLIERQRSCILVIKSISAKHAATIKLEGIQQGLQSQDKCLCLLVIQWQVTTPTGAYNAAAQAANGHILRLEQQRGLPKAASSSQGPIMQLDVC